MKEEDGSIKTDSGQFDTFLFAFWRKGWWKLSDLGESNRKKKKIIISFRGILTKNSKYVNCEMETDLKTFCNHLQHGTRVMTVYTDGIFPVSPKAASLVATTATRDTGSKYSSHSSVKIFFKAMTIYITFPSRLGSEWRLALLASTSSALYYSRVMLRCLYCHLLAELEQFIQQHNRNFQKIGLMLRWKPGF